MRTNLDNYPSPTLAMIVRDMRDANSIVVTERDVVQAAQNRDVPIKDGRIDWRDIGNLYLEIGSWQRTKEWREDG